MNIPVCKRIFTSLVLFSFFIVPVISQQPIKKYTTEWKKVDDLVTKKLPQSALAEVKKIYALAKQEKQDAQIIKSLIYMSGLQQENREENEEATIKEMEKEIASIAQPARSILYSLLADLYWTYFNNVRWGLYNRTNTEKFVKEDFKTWNAQDFHRVISSLYLASIKEEKLLQQTKLESYNAIIDTYGYRFLRPTLYDFLAHHALDYFTNEEKEVIKPAYRFVINQPESFAPHEEFIKTKFITKDTGSLFYKAYLIFQQLLKYHAADTRRDALVDLDIRRLTFVYEYGVMKDKDKLYEDALAAITTKFPNDSSAAYASYLVANIYFERGWYRGISGKNKHPKALLTAASICNEIIRKFPKSSAANQCERLLSQIKEKDFSTEVERVNLPGKPFRFLFKYRNINKIHMRLVKMTQAEIKKLQTDIESWKKQTNLKPIREWTQDIPDPKDFNSYSVELKVDALPIGTYFLLISEKSGFPATENIICSEVLHISSISYVGYGGDYFVLDRETGKPLADATVQTWQRKYDYTTSAYISKKSGLFKTDKNGMFKLVKNADDGNFSFEITHGNDYLFVEDEIYMTYDSRHSTVQKSPLMKQGYLFTDRSIYRPGQLIYFKGLVIQFDPNTQKRTILPGFTSKVTLRDASYQKIGEITVTSNEFGTYHGSFKIPEGKLNGSFTLMDSLTNAYEPISVEEYKRPKFSVQVKKPSGTYRLNDSVTVKGVAKGFTGNPIDGALVKYRVNRSRYMPWWMGSTAKIYPPYNWGQLSVANGEATTDANGEFTITFQAIGDEEEYEEKEVVSYNFVVNADVTDINGETRSDETSIVVSNRAISLKLDVPERVLIDSFKTLKMASFNTNDLFERTALTVKISLLKSPTRLFRERRWAAPDQFVMTREESYQLFPHDVYSDEDDKSKWEKTKMLEDTFTTIEDDKFSFQKSSTYRIKPGINWQPGWYEVEIMARDKYGDTVLEKKFVQLYTPATSHITYRQGIMMETIKSSGEPGEKLRYRLSTPLTDVWVLQQTTGFREKEAMKTDILNAESREYELDITEQDRGGRNVNWMFIKNNRIYTGSQLFTVPWTNKQLEITYETFRDVLLPGSQEKWKIKIKGAKGDKTAAELLVSMYDASLDQFKNHHWKTPAFYHTITDYNGWQGHNSFSIANKTATDVYKKKEIPEITRIYDRFYFGPIGADELWTLNNWDYGLSNVTRPRLMRLPRVHAENDQLELNATPQFGLGLTGNLGVKFNGNVLRGGSWKDLGNEQGQIKNGTGAETQVRKNFNETAFFFPELRTDSAGAIEFSFTMPEALTTWKLMAFATTKDLAFGYSTKDVVTKKQLMVQPNPPRFMREGDKMEFSAKVVNMTDKEITGQAQFQLFDAATNESVDGRFKNVVPNQYFTVAAGASEPIRFPVEVPYQFNTALTWRVIVRAGDVSDGEENALPVLTNRMLVTETMPINMRGTGTKNFTFDKLLNSGNSETLQNHSFVVEYTSNPAWNAVQALPYLMEYPYDCAEQTWNRYYANSLASMIANSAPRIKQIFEQWKIKDTAALLSNLQKNPELKAVLLEETPWILQAKSESEQKKNIALLFDMIRMNAELNSSFEKLKQMQSSNGGFVWFKGGPDDRYMTQYILTGIGHLKKLKALEEGQQYNIKSLLDISIPYLDKKIKEDYDQLVKLKVDLKKQVPGTFIIQYLYMRSFFPDYKIDPKSQKAYDYYKGRAKQTWTQQGKYMQGMLALALSRGGDAATPAAILKSLKETSVSNEEMGRYWKDVNRGWFWYEAPIERQALLIEAFQEIGKDTKTVDDMRTWLLKHKQTNNWESTKATAEACYALLLRGSQWLTNEPVVEIRTGNITISTNDNKQEAGTGYFKKTIEGERINPKMGNISVTVFPANQSTNQPINSPSWGGIYWQYFEDLDKITTASTPLKLAKKLFIEKNSDRGPVLTPVNDGDILKVGDKIKVRIELRIDRDMEYVHMKDMRASATEPVNVLSNYKWQGGLGYYESTKDASTNFFFGTLRKGTYVFEYPLFITHTGNFSNGITTIQSMYAPEFSSHSEGIRINVE